MGRTYRNPIDDRRGGGYEYWSRRIRFACPGRHKSGKKKTHTFERAKEKHGFEEDPSVPSTRLKRPSKLKKKKPMPTG